MKIWCSTGFQGSEGERIDGKMKGTTMRVMPVLVDFRVSLERACNKVSVFYIHTNKRKQNKVLLPLEQPSTNKGPNLPTDAPSLNRRFQSVASHRT